MTGFLRGCLKSPTVTLSEVEGSGSEGWGTQLGRHQNFRPATMTNFTVRSNSTFFDTL